MKINSKMTALMAAALFCAAGIITAQADTILTFGVDMSTNVALNTFIPGTDTVAVRGTFNGYGTLNLVQDQSQLPEYIYTNSVDDTSDANGAELQYKFWDSNASGGWENTADGQNRAALLPSTSGATLVLPVPFFSDSGALVTNNVTFQVDVAEQGVLGNYIPGTSGVTVAGLFNGWNTTTCPLVQSSLTGLTAGEPANTVYTNTYPVVSSPNAAEEYKFVITNLPSPGTIWDSPDAANSDGGANRYYANYAQTLPLVNFSDEPYVALLCTNVFSVDMSAPAAYDASFEPGSVTINGAFNGWGASIPMTNDPTAANPNLYLNSEPVVYVQGATFQYQFRYQDSTGTVYDHLNGENGGSGNRSVTEPNQYNYTAPTVYFNDAPFSDYLSQPVAVTFSLLMNTSDVGTGGTPTWAPGTPVFVNGPWPNWLNWDPISLGSQQLTETPINGTSSLYTGTFTIPMGILTSLTYKYGMNGADNEAGSGANLARVIRSTVTGAYTFAQDTWANQYVEPSFGELTAGPASAGTVPVSWLGRPGCELQTTPSLTSPSWTSLPVTDGTNWTAGIGSTNGLISVTNYPATGGPLFFRLIKQ